MARKKEVQEEFYDKDGNRVVIQNGKKKGGCLKWVLIAIVVIALISACGAMLGGGDDTSSDETTTETTTKDENNKDEGNKDEGTKEESKEESAEETDLEKTYAVGETLEHNGIKITVTETERIEPGDMDFLDEGDNYVRAYLVIENNSDKEISYNSFDYEIQTSDGNIMDSFGLPPSGGNSKTLDSGKLTPGGKVEGNLYFEVPADDNGLILRYAPSFFSNETLKFDLSN